MGRLDGVVAMVTGAARGQGEAIARAFVSEGAAVVLGDVLAQEGEAIAKSLGSAALFVPLDVSSELSWAAAVARAQDQFGKLTALVNNAGIHINRPIAETSLEDYRRIIDVNQVGCWLGMKIAAPAIAAAGGGSIVNTSSTAGLKGLSGRSAYGASKWAVRGMSRVAAIEFGADGIRVNTVFPGPIETGMISDTTIANVKRHPIARLGRVQEVAALMVYLCSAESSYCTGAEFVIDGGMMA